MTKGEEKEEVKKKEEEKVSPFEKERLRGI